MKIYDWARTWCMVFCFNVSTFCLQCIQNFHKLFKFNKSADRQYQHLYILYKTYHYHLWLRQLLIRIIQYRKMTNLLFILKSKSCFILSYIEPIKQQQYTYFVQERKIMATFLYSVLCPRRTALLMKWVPTWSPCRCITKAVLVFVAQEALHEN